MSPPLPPEPVIRVRDLFRSFGNIQAVRGISFDILPGQVVGFIGANGAGKTTTMRMMATLELPTAGSIHIGGYSALSHPAEVRRRVGWMPDHFGTYDNVTVWEYLDFFARAYGYKGAEREARVREVMDFADLGPIRDRLMDKLSKGMGQRLCLGRTLLHDPQVLIMDEPAAGLDPKARIELKNLIRLLADEGKTLFISSHILSELGEMCDTLLFIDAGKIVHHGSAETLLRAEEREEAIIEIELDGDPQPLLNWIALNPGVVLTSENRRGAVVTLADPSPEAIRTLLRRLVHDNIPVTDYHRRQRRLEDAFVDVLKKAHAPTK